MALRLIDLRINWLLQYVGEITTFDPNDYPDVKPRLDQIRGYLQDTRAAIVTCDRSPSDWAKQTDRSKALADVVARVEAEFPGRILIGPTDRARFEAEPESLCWVILQTTSDVEPLADWFDRGVRVFHLTDPDHLDLLASLGSADGPKPAVDLGGLTSTGQDEALTWFEADPSRRSRLFPILTTATGQHPLQRLRALNGLVGLDLGPTAEDLAATIGLLLADPSSHAGIAISTNFLERPSAASELATVEAILQWLTTRFGQPVAESIAHTNAMALIRHITGE